MFLLTRPSLSSLILHVRFVQQLPLFVLGFAGHLLSASLYRGSLWPGWSLVVSYMFVSEHLYGGCMGRQAILCEFVDLYDGTYLSCGELAMDDCAGH